MRRPTSMAPRPGGCAPNSGTVFKLDSQGEETVLHTFAGKDGAAPLGALIP
jgi:uncharacterized repeat protein (TIGR03803 family)